MPPLGLRIKSLIPLFFAVGLTVLLISSFLSGPEPQPKIIRRYDLSEEEDVFAPKFRKVQGHVISEERKMAAPDEKTKLQQNNKLTQMRSSDKHMKHEQKNEMEEKNIADIKLVHDSFKECIGSDGKINLDIYIRAYNELFSFLNLMGKVFAFVGSDVQEKITILEIHRKSGVGRNYKTIDNMLLYEVSNDITIVKGTPPSGSRTMLRLHRALLFLSEFFRHLVDVLPSERIGKMTLEVYKRTLAKHHTWLVQKAMSVATYALPTRENLVERLCGGACQKSSKEELVELVTNLPEVIMPVYNATQALYETHNLLDLP